jgi:hypothetical protein
MVNYFTQLILAPREKQVYCFQLLFTVNEI